MAELVYTLNTWDIRDITNSGSTLTINGVVGVLGSEIYAGDYLLMTAADGYQFYWLPDDNRNSVFMNISGTGDVNQYFQLQDNGASAFLNVVAKPPGSVVNWITVQNRPIQPPDDHYYLIQQIDVDNMKRNNVTATLGGKPVITGTPVYAASSIILTATGGAKFQQNNYNAAYTCAWGKNDNSYVNATVNSPYTTATQTMSSAFNSVTGKDQISRLLVTTVLNATSTDGSVYDISNADLAQLVTYGVTLTKDGKPVTELYTKIYKGSVMLATCDDQREFTPDEVYFGVGTLGSVDSYVKFTIDSTKRAASLTYPQALPASNSVILLQTKTQQYIPDVVGSNKVYLIDNDKLASVNEQRFYENIDSGVFYDYGQYILSVIQLPFNVPPSMIAQSEPIQLATKALTVSAPLITDDVIILDMGEITVAGTYNDLRDYVNTVALLHLPRIQAFAIDLEYVINQTIHIKYLIDVYTGQATVNIHSTTTGTTILTQEVNLGVQVPMVNKTDDMVENSNISVGGDNEILTPYIEIIRNPAILANGKFTIPIIDEALISTAQGFIKVEEVELKTDALRAEKSEIVSQLQNGVIIK